MGSNRMRRRLVVGAALLALTTTIPSAPAAAEPVAGLPTTSFPLGEPGIPKSAAKSLAPGVSYFTLRHGTPQDGYTVSVVVKGKDFMSEANAQAQATAVQMAGLRARHREVHPARRRRPPRRRLLHGAGGQLAARPEGRGRRGRQTAQGRRGEREGRLPGRRRLRHHRPLERAGHRRRPARLPRLVPGVPGHERRQAGEGLGHGLRRQGPRRRERRLLRHPHAARLPRRPHGHLRRRRQAAQRGRGRPRGPGPPGPYGPRHRLVVLGRRAGADGATPR